MRSAAAILACFSALAGAVQYAGVSNYCDFDAYIWYVGGNVSEPVTSPAEGGYAGEAIQHDPISGGRTIKIFTEEDGLYKGAPHLSLAYSYEDPLVWYELGEVFGSPFEGHRLKMEALAEGCETFEWENGVQPAERNLQVCDASKGGFKLSLCADQNPRE